MKALPQLVTPRTAARITRMPWPVLRRLLEKNGARICRLGDRERVAEADLVALIEAARQPTIGEAADRVGLAIHLAAQEMGIARRPRRRVAQ